MEDFGNWSDQEMMAEELLIVDELDCDGGLLVELADTVCGQLHDAGIIRGNGPADIPLSQVKRYLIDGIKEELKNLSKHLKNAWTIKAPVGVFWMREDETRAETEGVMSLRFYGLHKNAIINVMNRATKLLSSNDVTVSKVNKKYLLEFCTTKCATLPEQNDAVLDASAVLKKLGWAQDKIKTILNLVVGSENSSDAGVLVASALRRCT